ncbi:MAG: L-serine ammonia-lyase [Candidatus Pacebacteria bacterium]|nr:L-serine ammonia-lyase [Candidatus Paceibacterota bacterium]
MYISFFDLFKIGLGPSSSHTTGPMRAAARFVHGLAEAPQPVKITRLVVELYGSLALTGRGHSTDLAVLLGISGYLPENLDPEQAQAIVAKIRTDHRLTLPHDRVIEFKEDRDLLFHMAESLPGHPNGMRLTAYSSDGTLLHREVYYSIGGGFIVTEAELHSNNPDADAVEVPYPFTSGDELLALCKTHGLSIEEIVRANEYKLRSQKQLEEGMDRIWATMQACVQRGLTQDGILPGGLGVTRRAPLLYQALVSKPEASLRDPLTVMDWVNIYAMAVNEENAVGGKVVTAPTNGAAGIIPAVLHYYERFCIGADRAGIHRFLLTATAIGSLYKQNASISGAEVGCQGEVGVACSMAAAGLVAALGGSVGQAENAAEIGMEHNLGLTCDPVKGLVQIPCIERNAMGAIKAINAARLAMRGDGSHQVSLDRVIETMRQTGADMDHRYKETSMGGLAVNFVEC